MPAIWTVLILMMFLTISNLYQQFRPIKALSVEQPVKVLTKKVVAGESMIYEIHFCRYLKGVVHATRTLRGPITYSESSITNLTETGCQVKEVLFPVPKGSPAGRYHLDTVVEFEITSNRKITVPYSSEEFEVIP